MTDPLTTALDGIDATRKRLLSARFVVENAVRFRDQAVRLGFEPEVMANHTGFGMWVPFSAELTAALAEGGVVPPAPEVVVSKPLARRTKGRQWTATDDSDLLARLQRGETRRAIAVAMGRSGHSISGRISKLRARGLIGADDVVTAAPDDEDPHDAGKPWPAVRDDYQPPVEVEPDQPASCEHTTTARVHSTGALECVSCHEIVSAHNLPPIKDTRGRPVQSVVKREGWTADDEADLIERLNRGESTAQIAAETNRVTKSVAGKITYMRSRGLLVDQQLTKPDPKPQPVTTAPAKASEPVTPPTPAKVIAPAPKAELQPEALDDEADFWTATRKRDLVGNILRGMKLAQAADLIGCSESEARAMWRALCPNPTLDRQRKLMARLNAEASAEQVAA